MSLRLENVSFVYEAGTPMERTAVYPLSLTVKAGETLAIIGATGSGKSTLIQMMNGLNKPSTGNVYFHDQDIFADKYDRRALRSRVGLLFQYPEYQLFETDVLKDICFGPKNQGLSEEECLRRARAAMAAVGLSEEYETRSPFEISGGEKRRVALAGVLAMDPEILILDEPTAGLDPAGREELLQELDSLKTGRQMGIVIVSHSMEDVAKLADRILVLSRGRILTEGDPHKVFAQDALLREAGLDLPAPTRIINRLKEAGLPLEAGVLSVEEARDAIVRMLCEKHSQEAPDRV